MNKLIKVPHFTCDIFNFPANTWTQRQNFLCHTSHDRGVTCGWWCDKATPSLSLLLAQVSKFFTFAILRFPQRWCCDAEMDNSGKEKEAMALMAEAEKKMKSSQSFFGSLFGWVCHFGYYLANVDKLKANKAERLKHIDWHHIYKAGHSNL